ncbi:MAG: sigma-54 dependent transcriptional regulator [Sterolibacterium sp.]
MKTEGKHRGEAGIRVLVVDDEPDIRELLDLTLARMGLAADCVGSVGEAKRLLTEKRYRLCLTDMRLPDGEGLELVRHIGEHCQELPVAVITAYGSMENAVSALKAGAFDYLAKPVSLEQLRLLVRSAIDLPQRSEGDTVSATYVLFGDSPAMSQTRALIERVARSQAPVYISGESGSGKELAASLIHRLGARRGAPFIAVNCGAIPENLMESEFFGYRKGAFTGAESERDGFFQAAGGGTLFLDEVADLPLAMQVKLLRIIQEKRVRKVGATSEDAVDVRIICATHQNLKALVEQGRFRQDLFYRLNVIEVRMPSLRECREDIPLLARHILERLANVAGVPVPPLTPAALTALDGYSFPGNVRELENVLERALALLTDSAIDVADLHLVAAVKQHDHLGFQEHLDQVEKQLILDALQKTRFNRTAAAKLLGVTFRSLRYRMQRLGLNERE